MIKKKEDYTSKKELTVEDERDLSFLYGDMDRNRKFIEDAFGIEVKARGNKILIEGEEEAVESARKLLDELSSLGSEGFSIQPEDIRYAIRAFAEDKGAPIRELFLNAIPVSSKKRFIIPKTEGQRRYVDAIREYDIVIGIGPAGTGKTYLAMAMAVSALIKKEVARIILARPAVEAGEKLGFLPGDMYEKVNPYLRPLYDALFDMIEMDKANKLLERGVIEIAPLAFMRGRTLNDSFIILDEAQNTTSEQMKMYLTRLGFNSKTVITGDITQVDLPSGKASGLIESQKILSDIKGIKFIYFTEKDVVRHRLVQEIIKAYERYEKGSKGEGE